MTAVNFRRIGTPKDYQKSEKDEFAAEEMGRSVAN